MGSDFGPYARDKNQSRSERFFYVRAVMERMILALDCMIFLSLIVDDDRSASHEPRLFSRVSNYVHN